MSPQRKYEYKINTNVIDSFIVVTFSLKYKHYDKFFPLKIITAILAFLCILTNI